MTPSSTYLIRAPRPSEHAFMLATFINGWCKNQISNMRSDPKRWAAVPRVFRSVSMDDLCESYHRSMNELLQKGLCLVAADDTVLLGFIVASLPSTLHWIYVKPDFNGFGIDSDLLRSCHLDETKPVIVPYRNSGIVRLLRSSGFRDC